jgi:UDP-N-acetylmuramoyl-L-alanyl-D-glutamate--2,6-diaminopimelate ligase
MLWNDLKKHVDVESTGGDADPDITDVTCDSRSVTPGALYVSIPGFKSNGDTFIPDAIAKGASAIISENHQKTCSIPWAQVANTRKALGIVSREVWKVDLSDILFVGITGTNGKTTTAYLFQNLFSRIFGRNLAWMFGTIQYSTGKACSEASRTTPESSDVFRQIGRSFEKPRSIVMEVSSHSLALNRIAGIGYDCAIWTNCTQDHLDFHKSMEAYYQAKKLLFTQYLKKNGKAVINIDDPWGRRLACELPGVEKITYGQSEDAVVRIVRGDSSDKGTEIDLRIGEKTSNYSSKLAGHFNIYNMTALAAGAYALSIDAGTAAECLKSMEVVPGRMDRVPLEAGFSVFVDYAHTPDALENVLSTARKITGKKLICVFGCGGDRDKIKRPLMATAVADNCDEAIITSDNPRSENPDLIIRDILKGMPLDFSHIAIVDRKEAIKRALLDAKDGDCIIVAGKGHENYQEVKGVRSHFDDKETIRELFEEVFK